MGRITKEEILDKIREKRTLWMSLGERRVLMMRQRLKRSSGLLRDLE